MIQSVHAVTCGLQERERKGRKKTSTVQVPRCSLCVAPRLSSHTDSSYIVPVLYTTGFRVQAALLAGTVSLANEIRPPTNSQISTMPSSRNSKTAQSRIRDAHCTGIGLGEIRKNIPRLRTPANVSATLNFHPPHPL